MDQYSAARTIATALISSRLDSLTIEEIRRCVDEAFTHFPDATMESRERLTLELEASYQTIIGEERQLVGDDEGWDPWLPSRMGSIEWSYWERYKELLTQGAMNADVRQRLDESTYRVLGLLGDPQREGSWDRRGLVVGLVQSGKTSHYVGLVNKAVDAGYKVIVILTGFTESLRVQTQIRAEEGFLGFFMEPGTKKNEMRAHRTGVGKIAPAKRPDSVTTRRNDFKKGIAQNFAIQVGGNEILFVIKKNVGVIGNLLNWIESFGDAVDAEDRRFVKGVPLLVIDDESDVGSIDTRKGNIVDDDPDPDHEPSRINEQIRKLLSLFDQSSYVGYTATPFANVLIHDGGYTNELGEDLFPRSFIVSLPTPSDHIGPSMVFGHAPEDGNREEGLPVVRHIPEREADGESAWIPPVHKKSHRPTFAGTSEVPPSLRKAILSFVLVCSARRLRQVDTKHNSMLVHVTRFNDVQAIVDEQVKKELAGIVDRLRSKTADDGLLRELEGLWVDDFSPTTERIRERGAAMFMNPLHSWSEIRQQLLPAASSIQVRTINGLAGEVLDYETHEDDGLSVIAIGGDKLSRGLTLAGLSVSYFLRCSRMYDTLMQMGRWFGYRPGYLDLCRLFTTAELCEWFGHIANATEELRAEFDLMASSGGTPKDFGLKVRSHPELMVTSQVKMRHGQTIPITFQGKFVETDSFYRDRETVERNWGAVTNLVSGLVAGGGKRAKAPRENTDMWSNVSAGQITAFLEGYREHDSATKVRTRYLVEYIEKEVRRGRLISWTVLISGGGAARKCEIGSGVRLVNRGWKLSGSTKTDQEVEKKELMARNQFRTGILLNPPDEQVDLAADVVRAAMDETLQDWRRDPRGRDKEPTVPAGRFLRQQRDPKNGLLVLYPIAPDAEKSEAGNAPIAGFVISFPAVDGASASNVTFTVNNVYQQLEMSYQ